MLSFVLKKESVPDPGVVAICVSLASVQARKLARSDAPLFKTEPAALTLRFCDEAATADSLRGRCVGVIDYVVPAKPMHGLCG